MAFINKTAMTEEFCYKFRYKLITINDVPTIHIHLLKYDKKSYLKNAHATPLCTETNFSPLPKTLSEADSEKIFNEIAENLVFPISLDYILEDMNFPSSNGINYKMETAKNKSKLAQNI